MKPQSMTHKILARASGRAWVESGEIIEPELDLCVAHDATVFQIRELFYQEFGADAKVWNPERIALFQDHMVPAKDAAARHCLNAVAQFGQEQGIAKTFLYGADYGICHVMVSERGMALPGQMIVGNDSHSTTYGAFNAFAAGAGMVDVLNAFYTGDLWFQVPEVIEVRCEGRLPPNVMAKDLILRIIGDLGQDGASGKTLEFTGSTIDTLPVAERMTMCNMAIECGATNGIMGLSAQTEQFLRRCTAQTKFTPVTTDADFVYHRRLQYRAEALEPMVALPHSPDNVHPISSVKTRRIPVRQVYVGSCTGGKLMDIETVANTLAGQRIAPDLQLMVIPATMAIYRALLQNGIAEKLLDAGAVIESPGCKACYGEHSGILGDGEACLSTTNRNFRGRMGNPKSSVYLASPYIAACTALSGFITD